MFELISNANAAINFVAARFTADPFTERSLLGGFTISGDALLDVHGNPCAVVDREAGDILTTVHASSQLERAFELINCA